MGTPTATFFSVSSWLRSCYLFASSCRYLYSDSSVFMRFSVVGVSHHLDTSYHSDGHESWTPKNAASPCCPSPLPIRAHSPWDGASHERGKTVFHIFIQQPRCHVSCRHRRFPRIRGRRGTTVCCKRTPTQSPLPPRCRDKPRYRGTLILDPRDDPEGELS